MILQSKEIDLLYSAGALNSRVLTLQQTNKDILVFGQYQVYVVVCTNCGLRQDFHKNMEYIRSKYIKKSKQCTSTECANCGTNSAMLNRGRRGSFVIGRLSLKTGMFYRKRVALDRVVRDNPNDFIHIFPQIDESGRVAILKSKAEAISLGAPVYSDLMPQGEGLVQKLVCVPSGVDSNRIIGFPFQGYSFQYSLENILCLFELINGVIVLPEKNKLLERMFGYPRLRFK